MSNIRPTTGRLMAVVGLIALELQLFRYADPWLLVVAVPTLTLGSLGWLLTGGKLRHFFQGFTVGGLFGIVVTYGVTEDMFIRRKWYPKREFRVFDVDYVLQPKLMLYQHMGELDVWPNEWFGQRLLFIASNHSVPPTLAYKIVTALSLPAPASALVGGLLALTWWPKTARSHNPSDVPL